MPLIKSGPSWSQDGFLEIKNGHLKKESYEYSLLFSRTKRIWPKVVAVLKHLVVFCTKYKISIAKIDLERLADLAEDDFFTYSEPHMIPLF